MTIPSSQTCGIEWHCDLTSCKSIDGSHVPLASIRFSSSCRILLQQSNSRSSPPSNLELHVHLDTTTQTRKSFASTYYASRPAFPVSYGHRVRTRGRGRPHIPSIFGVTSLTPSLPIPSAASLSKPRTCVLCFCHSRFHGMYYWGYRETSECYHCALISSG